MRCIEVSEVESMSCALNVANDKAMAKIKTWFCLCRVRAIAIAGPRCRCSHLGSHAAELEFIAAKNGCLFDPTNDDKSGSQTVAIGSGSSIHI